MEYRSSRRLFLFNTVLASAGLTLLPSTTLATNLTTSPCLFDGYSPHSEEKIDLRTSLFSEKQLTVKGTVFDSSGSFPKANILIEVWHLSPNSSKFRHRAKLTTNNAGEYFFITDFPNKKKGTSPRIYFKISNKNTIYFTELIVTDSGAFITGKHWEENKQLGDKVFPQKKGATLASTIIFNTSI